MNENVKQAVGIIYTNLRLETEIQVMCVSFIYINETQVKEPLKDDTDKV